MLTLVNDLSCGPQLKTLLMWFWLMKIYGVNTKLMVPIRKSQAIWRCTWWPCGQISYWCKGRLLVAGISNECMWRHLMTKFASYNLPPAHGDCFACGNFSFYFLGVDLTGQKEQTEWVKKVKVNLVFSLWMGHFSTIFSFSNAQGAGPGWFQHGKGVLGLLW